MNILVLGIGQSMRGDDAAGLEAVRLWQVRHPGTAAQVKVEFSENPGLALLDLLEGMDIAIIVDAVHSTPSAGSIIRLGPEELASFTPDTGSAHGWGVAEALQLGYTIFPVLAKCQISLIGILGRNFKVGAALSPVVHSVLAEVAGMVEGDIQKYTK